MRELTYFEVQATSGGLYCTDKEGLKKIVWQAVTDGAMVAGILSPVIGMGTYVATAHIAPGAALTAGLIMGFGAIVPLAVLGTVYSSAWNVLN